MPGAFARSTAERKLSVGYINSHLFFFCETTQMLILVRIRLGDEKEIVPFTYQLML